MPKKRATARKPSSKRAKLGGTLPETTESYLSDDDIYLFNEGNHFRLYEKLGSRLHETPPRTASVVWDLDYQWGDENWMKTRRGRNSLEAPMSIYEVHLGSWRRVPEDGNRSLSYREVAPRLAEYGQEMGFTPVEVLPPTDHPFYGSGGYQPPGSFAPPSRYGTPQDLMYLVDV